MPSQFDGHSPILSRVDESSIKQALIPPQIDEDLFGASDEEKNARVAVHNG
jgi:hypothetical protein